MKKKTLQVIGPFFTHYSYARMNRGLAIAIDKLSPQYEVSLWGEKDKIDYYPLQKELSENPFLERLVREKKTFTDVAIYNNFPRNQTDLHGFKDLPGTTKLMYLAWEESLYPRRWVNEANTYLHGFLVISTFVRDILRNSGVKIPIEVVNIGIDDKFMVNADEKFSVKTQKSFKFLHVSTAKQRKGVDVLLKSYFQAFTKTDDVALILKTTSNPDNIVDQILFELQDENSPEVIHIKRNDLTDEEMAGLHKFADCEVYPSRAEGFGLPIAEAMFFKKPVIVTNYSGHLDFCDESSAYLIDYKLDYAKKSELVNLGAMWAEPDPVHLSSLMKQVYGAEKAELEQKTKRAYERVKTLTWENAAKSILEVIPKIEKVSRLKGKKYAAITTLNSECGIAEYSRDLYSKIENSFREFYYISNWDIADRVRKDKSNVIRAWEVGEGDFSQTKQFLAEKSIEIVHIQYHSGSFFPPESLHKLIEILEELDITIYLTFHAVYGEGFDFIREVKNLSKVNKVFVHNQPDFDYARKFLDNAVLFHIPVSPFKKRSEVKVKKTLGFQDRSPIIASHGLMNKNKSIPEIIRAVAELKHKYPNILFLSLNAISSNNTFSASLYDECKLLSKKLDLKDNVRFFTDFLDMGVVEVLLQSSDINVLAYDDAGESASAAVRKCIASGRPTIVTDIKMFAEFDKEVYKIKDSSVKSIVGGITGLLEEGKSTSRDISNNARKYINRHNFESKSVEMILAYD